MALAPANSTSPESDHAYIFPAATSSGLMACLWDDCLPTASTPGGSGQQEYRPRSQLTSRVPGEFEETLCAGTRPHAEDVLLDSTEALLRHLVESHLARNGSGADFLGETIPSSNLPLPAKPSVPLAPGPVRSGSGLNVKSDRPTSVAISGDPSTVHRCCWAGCSAAFLDAAALTTHLSEVHVGSNKSIYECLWAGCERCEEKGCNDCDTGMERCLKGRQFGSRQKVMRHLQSHTGYRPFVCTLCKQSFSEQATLSAHLRRHANEKPFKCDYPGCKKAFAVMASLTIHKRVHEGDRKHKCPYCDKAFVEVSNLTKHLRMHTGERPFACNQCDKAFPRLDQLKRHLASNHDLKAE